MRVIDLFSGVGGISTGLKMTNNIEIVLANEIDKTIAASYQKNHPSTIMINSDIKDFYNYSNDVGEIDAIVGGPPCQGFSLAGTRNRKRYRFIDDERNYLFRWYYNVVKKYEPPLFVMENVTGIVSMKNGDIMNEIMNIFSDPSNFTWGGYKVYPIILDASDFGVPQERKRFFLFGSKDDIDFDQYIIRTKNHMIETGEIYETTIRDAISDLNFLESGEGQFVQKYPRDPQSRYQEFLRQGANKLYNHTATNHNAVALDRMSRLDPGNNRHNLAEGHSIKSIHSGSYGRMEWDSKAKTIITRFDTPSSGVYIHPEKNRTITPREAARLQSFPDTVIFHGNKSSVIRQIGNAVPPLMAKFIGNVILKIREDFR